MKDFILVREDLTDKLMIIRKSSILMVEEYTIKNRSCRKVTFTDRTDTKYVQDPLVNILKELESDNTEE